MVFALQPAQWNSSKTSAERPWKVRWYLTHSAACVPYRVLIDMITNEYTWKKKFSPSFVQDSKQGWGSTFMVYTDPDPEFLKSSDLRLKISHLTNQRNPIHTQYRSASLITVKKKAILKLNHNPIGYTTLPSATGTAPRICATNIQTQLRTAFGKNPRNQCYGSWFNASNLILAQSRIRGLIRIQAHDDKIKNENKRAIYQQSHN